MAAAQGNPMWAPTKSPGEHDGFQYMKIFQLNVKTTKFILRARLVERTQMQEIKSSGENEFNLIRMLLADETGYIRSFVFSPKAEQINQLELGEVFDFFVKKADNHEAKNPIEQVGYEYSKQFPAYQVDFELFMNSLTNFFLESNPCRPRPNIPGTLFASDLVSCIDRENAFFTDNHRFNVMGVVSDIDEESATYMEEESNEKQFTIRDQSSQKMVLQVIGRGTEVANRFVRGSMIILIRGYVDGGLGKIISDNKGWIQVINSNFNEKASQLQLWWEAQVDE